MSTLNAIITSKDQNQTCAIAGMNNLLLPQNSVVLQDLLVDSQTAAIPIHSPLNATHTDVSSQTKSVQFA